MQSTFGSEGIAHQRIDFLTKFLRKVGITGNKPWREILMTEAQKFGRHKDVVLEFGVYKGRSTNLLARMLPNATVYAFDSFCGFPVDGRSDWQQDFSVDHLPKVRRNVNLQVGYFEKTLPVFIERHGNDIRNRVGLVHIDCDIYSSTLTVFNAIGEFLSEGVVIVFDEIINYPEFAFNEALALYDFLLRRGLDAKWSTNIGKMWLVDESEISASWIGWKDFRQHGFFQNQSVVLCNRGEGGLIDKSMFLDPSPALVDYVVSGMEDRGLHSA